MNTKQVAAHGVIALVAVSLTSYTYSVSPQLNTSDRRGVVVFPELVAKANDIATISIRDKDRTITIERNEKGFFDKDSKYPVKPELFRDLVGNAATLSFEEAKTSDEKRYVDLGLADPEKEKSDKAGREVTIRDGKNNVLATFWVGNRENSVGGARAGQYMRFGSDKQTWLVRGTTNVPAPHTAWFEINFFNMNKDALESIDISGGDLPEIKFVSAKKGDDIRLASPVPEGRKEDTNKSLRVAFMVDPLSFEDVRQPKEELKPTGRKLVAKDRDGLVVTVQSVGKFEDGWVRLTVEGTTDDSKKRAEGLKPKMEGFEFKLIPRYFEIMGWKLEDFTEEVKS
jgi:hypothetical protein